ncbi:MAG: acyl-CoA dehydrogenase family protein [Actinobacteria bacterium]|nr:acyl-CoA dehydrogenase family protein [Actinomycetota bacterium]
MWDFSTDPEFQAQLDWMDGFVRDRIEPLDALFGSLTYHSVAEPLRTMIGGLKDEVRERGLWACHLGPDLGGQGFGQLKLALMNEILGRSSWAPIVFGCAAPDTGNAEIIAHYGTDEQKERWLRPLLEGEVFSCYSMTEPQGGADPTMIRTRAVRDGDEWVITGEKFFSSNLRTSSFLIVMAVTDPDVSPYRGMSMFLVPSDAPGIEVLANIGLGHEPWGEGMHAHVRYDGVRVPAENLLGGEGQAFVVAQTRLGGGRIHHAMRAVAMARRQLDVMCERALSRQTKGEALAEKQLVQDAVADSWIQLQSFRLMVLHTAWLIDQSSTAEARRQIAACKVLAAEVLSDIAGRAQHLHGALGVSNLMRFPVDVGTMMGIMDGPTEVHKVSVARSVLKDHRPSDDAWPTEFAPKRVVRARRRFDELVDALQPNDEQRAGFDRLVQASAADDVTVAQMQAYLDATAGNL